MLNSILIYAGITIFVILSILRIVFSVQYIHERKRLGKLPANLEELKIKYLKKRRIVTLIGLIGLIISIVGIFIK